MQLQSSNLQGQNISATQIPTSQEAVAAYENLGGRLTVFPTHLTIIIDLFLEKIANKQFIYYENNAVLSKSTDYHDSDIH